MLRLKSDKMKREKRGKEVYLSGDQYVILKELISKR